MEKIALFTVFYPGAEIYVDDFFQSIKSQTCKNFELIIVNDGYKDKNLQSLCPELPIIELGGANKISTNRAIGIKYAIDNHYDYLLLFDVDDYFSPLRVEKSVEAIADADIIVNDLDIVDANRKVFFESYFSKSIGPDIELNPEFLLDKNIFGFSNTALRVSKLERITFPEDLQIVDWYYFTILLREGLHAKFLPLALTEYRQHSANMIGIATYSLEMFKNLLLLKKKHYSYFKGIDEYDKRFLLMDKIENMTDEEKMLLLEKNERQIPYPLWWQNIRIS